MSDIILTEEQQNAVDWIARRVGEGAKVVALRGYAGSGKTSIIGHIRKAIEQLGIGTALGAATHRAAMVLKRKGWPEAATYHSHAFVMHFKGDYAVAVEWFGEDVPCRATDHAMARPFVEDIPALIHERLARMLKRDRQTPEQLRAQWPRHRAASILRSIGIDPTQYFAGPGPRPGVGCLLIDEASMLSAEELEICMEAFPSLVLIGDPGQLPPVQGTPVLHTAEGIELQTIQRQAADSPIIQLATAARKGRNWWGALPLKPEQVERWHGAEASQFLTSPLIVGKNTTRKACTKMIREALGYPADRPVVGEPIVCKQSDKRAKGGAFYNNALFRVVAVEEDNPRLVRLREEDSEKEYDITIHLEELYEDKYVPLGAIQCRFGYVYTAHTAQGGEWPTVFISEPGLLEWRRALYHMKSSDQFDKWGYTAITRAKTLLVLLDKHHFVETIRPEIPQWEDYAMPRIKREDTEGGVKPPSAPLMGMDPNEPEDIIDPQVPAEAIEAPTDTDIAMASAVPGLPEPVAAPSNGFVPPTLPATAEPLLRGFTQYMHAQLHNLLMDESLRVAKSADLTMQAMHDYVKQVIANMVESNHEGGPGALKTIATEGLSIHGAPYEATMSATTPEGYAVTLKVTKATPEALIQGITGLQNWLKSAGYGSAVGAEVAA